MQETQRFTPRLIVIKMENIKDKERNLKELREKQLVIHKGIPIRPPVDFSAEILQARRKQHDTVWEKKSTIKNTIPGKAIIQN